MNNISKEVKCERNYGIDFLRIFAMYMIVVVHIMNHGGVFGHEKSGAANIIDTFIAALVYSCVNCYALISGFVGYRENKYRHKFASLITMWFQVVFYGVLLTMLFKLTGWADVGLKQWVKAVLPVSTEYYWYFTAYVGVVLVAPYINFLLDIMSKKAVIAMCVGIFVFFSVYSTGIVILGDPFALKAGFTFVWLSALYIIGAAIKKYDIYVNKIGGVLLSALSCIIVTVLSKISIGWISTKLIGSPKGAMLLYNYISPTEVLLSISLLILFANIRVSSKAAKLIGFAAPATFGVYLIHENPFSREALLVPIGKRIVELPGILPPFAVCGSALVILIVCLLIDRIRIVLFNVLKVKELSAKIDSLIHNVMEFILKKIGVSEK